MTLARVPAPVEGEVAPAPRREMSALRGPVAGVIAGLVVAGAAIGGYAIGHSGRGSSSEAAGEQRAAEVQAYADGVREAAARGRRDGFRAGAASGTRAGTRAGRGTGGVASPAKPAATPKTVPAGVRDCPKTPIRKKSFVSSVNGITCAAAAAETQQALKAGHPTRTPKGFTCQRIDAQHYRCTHGAVAYRWDISP